jgi:hypothetical protein
VAARQGRCGRAPALRGPHPGQIRELLTNYGKIDVLWYDMAVPLDAEGRSALCGIWWSARGTAGITCSTSAPKRTDQHALSSQVDPVG